MDRGSNPLRVTREPGAPDLRDFPGRAGVLPRLAPPGEGERR